ncbi:MAG: hypothetical protein Q4A82_01675 [Corynebacterium sp.]|nr:hypothetical protein [Corynebacterium sp.]
MYIHSKVFDDSSVIEALSIAFKRDERKLSFNGRSVRVSDAELKIISGIIEERLVDIDEQDKVYKNIIMKIYRIGAFKDA